MKIYAIQRTDGGVSIMRILDDSISPESEIARWPDDLRNGVSGIVEITEAQIPRDRSDRDAWALNGRGITVDATRKAQLGQQRQQEQNRTQLRDALMDKLVADPTILERIK